MANEADDTAAGRQSPLHEEHLRLGGRLVDFSGWNMPVQYSGIMAEHQAVREAVGIFDISHMGQFFVEGPDSMDWLNRLLANNVSKLENGQGQYTFMLNEDGGVIDDLILYRTGETAFFLVVNAAKISEDFAWMQSQLPPAGVEFRDESDSFAAMAVQGPESVGLWKKLFPSGPELPSRNGYLAFDSGDGDPLIVCRTGYTGEDGYEFFCPAGAGQKWLRAFLESGEGLGVLPCGLGARDSLRLEMCYPLNGSDLGPDRTPLQAGLGFFVDLEKGEFKGREVLIHQKAEGLGERLVAIEMIDKGPPPRPHSGVFHAGEQVGEVCSGGLSPTLGKGIAMAYLPVSLSKIDTEIEFDIRGRKFAGRVIKKPFVKKAKSA